MGVSNSKAETCVPLRLCKERKKFMKQAIDSRYNLAAAHLVYIQSLQNLGIALRKFAETQESLQQIQHSPNNPNLNYMKSSGITSLTVNHNPNPSNISSSSSNNNKVYVDDIESLPPPPPPPRFSWDYFDPADGSFRFMSHNRFQVKQNDANAEEEENDQNGHFEDNVIKSEENKSDQIEECDLIDDCLTQEEMELITHSGNDFMSSIKEIENHFIRASKSGNEVSRMLEASKIQVSYSEPKGSSTGSSLPLLTCFRGGNALVLHGKEPPHTPKLITWKRSTSTNSSLSNHAGPPTNDGIENNFTDEFCMIAGSHSSTLERLYAWERKLHDEVKASECIKKEYDRKCEELRHQFAKDLKPHLIDKTRAITKDLHSRMTVALHTVDSISKRIEKMRDEELQPQLMELIHGLIRMWKSMLECHHAQYITISLAYHTKISKTRTPNETKNEIMTELQHETECFGSSFSDLVKCYNSYIESINGWLQNCIIQPKERGKGRRVFSPRRVVAPPIFVISRDWSNGIQNMPSQKLHDAIKDFSSHIRRPNLEELENKEMDLIKNEEGMENGDVMGWDSSSIHASLTKVLDRLTKFSQDSLKMYEEIKEKGENAGNVYLNYKPPPRAFSI